MHQARFDGTEYVLTQLTDEMMVQSDANAMLKEEYRLLCQCDGFKAQFDEFSEAQDVLTISREYEIFTYSSFNLPLYAAFYFNFKGSIYGEIQASMTSGSRTIPKKNFLATLLLPCGKLDAKVKKFMGNDDIGDALDNMTKAVHAFAHWLLLYSWGHILFCNLQGIFLNHDRN